MEAEIHRPKHRQKPARWKTMARLEGRITQRQLTKLQTLRQKVTVSKQRAKLIDPKTPTERVTLNTFVRASLELLFLFEREIEGCYSEQEITTALKTAVQKLRSNNSEYPNNTCRENTMSPLRKQPGGDSAFPTD